MFIIVWLSLKKGPGTHHLLNMNNLCKNKQAFNIIYLYVSLKTEEFKHIFKIIL